MQPELPPPSRPTNRNAILSLVISILTLISFCMGAAPIPLTSLVCYPSGILLGLAALLTGFMALRQIRQTGQPGRWMAWTGIAMSGLTLLAILCAVTLVAIALPSLAQYLEQVWSQATH